jgi:hypothetical protein
MECWMHNKKGVRRILSRSGIEHSSGKNEDAITSMVFTPLRFMEWTEALECFKVIFGSKLSDRLKSRVVASFLLELWPRELRTTSTTVVKETRCEPDLVANIGFAEGPSLVIVGEMKWDSYPSKTELEDEINREKAALKAKNPGADFLIFSLVKYVKAGFDKLPCHMLSWTNFHRRLNECRNFARPGSPYRMWIEDVSAFLTLAEQTIFTGIKPTYAELPGPGSKPIFYRTGFRGFSMNYGEVPHAAGAPYFYAGRER